MSDSHVTLSVCIIQIYVYWYTWYRWTDPTVIESQFGCRVTVRFILRVWSEGSILALQSLVCNVCICKRRRIISLLTITKNSKRIEVSLLRAIIVKLVNLFVPSSLVSMHKYCEKIMILEVLCSKFRGFHFTSLPSGQSATNKGSK